MKLDAAAKAKSKLGVAKKSGGRRKEGTGTQTLMTSVAAVLIGIIGLYFFWVIWIINTGTTNSISRKSNSIRVGNLTAGASIVFAKLEVATKVLNNIRLQFNERYNVPGGDDSDNQSSSKDILTGNTLLLNGLHQFGSIDYTARRIIDASKKKRPFVFAFSGYSITVGRGNFFRQSFPFVMEEILKEPLQQIFGVPLIVRNAAIGGIPSFPYGFCMEHFLGKDPDVISWDYSMNEGAKDSSVLEAFIRQSTKQLPKRPMIIMLDTNKIRMDLLKEYSSRGWIHDAIAIGKKDILDENIFHSKNLPTGFKDWDEFGAPKSCPGRGSWHPKKQEHAMIGWIIAMHFINAMERAVEILKHDPNPAPDSDIGDKSGPGNKFSEPVSRKLPPNDEKVTDLLFGHRAGSDDNEYIIKKLSCRTSFLPATDHEKTLTSVVVDGMADGDLDIMIDRTDDRYKKGWVLDVSKIERDTKRKVENCGGLGYIDMKIALYGIPESETLRLWLPFEGQSHDHRDHGSRSTTHKEITARHWFDDIIICEANEKRGTKACQLDQDIEIIVGGIPITTIHSVNGAAEYLKRKTCFNVGIPETSNLVAYRDVKTLEGKSLPKTTKLRFGSIRDDALGIIVDIVTKPHVTRTNGACCLSHIVWEHH